MNDAFDSERENRLDDLDLEEILSRGEESADEARKKRAPLIQPSGNATSTASKKSTTSSWSSSGLSSSFGQQASASNRTDESSDSSVDDDQGRIAKGSASSTKQELIVAFQGEAGAYSEQALHNHFGPHASSLPCPDFASVFDAIHHGKSQRGILPVENSLAGTVSDAYDQLADHDLRIQGEVVLRIEHCLIAPAGLTLRDIKRVKSHPQALAQCQQTLRRQGIEALAHYDTAGAARDLAARPEPGTAAIASALAAKTYGLEILARHFEDEQLNYTRFFILGLDDPPRKVSRFHAGDQCHEPHRSQHRQVHPGPRRPLCPLRAIVRNGLLYGFRIPDRM